MRKSMPYMHSRSRLRSAPAADDAASCILKFSLLRLRLRVNAARRGALSEHASQAFAPRASVIESTRTTRLIDEEIIALCVALRREAMHDRDEAAALQRSFSFSSLLCFSGACSAPSALARSNECASFCSEPVLLNSWLEFLVLRMHHFSARGVLST